MDLKAPLEQLIVRQENKSTHYPTIMAEWDFKETEWVKRSRSLGEGVSESSTACLLTMVQGNVLVLTIDHLGIALLTGFIAGTLAFVITVIARINNPWTIALVLGISTTIIDYMIHPSSFGGIATEAIVTGIIAGLLSYLVAMWLKLRNKDYENDSKTQQIQ
jgi:hypothetical protein